MSRDEQIAPELPPGQAASGPLQLQMRLPSDARLLAVVRSAVSKLTAICGFADKECRTVTLAVDEALSNIIRHAYKNRCDRKIDLSFQAHADGVEFTFIDYGEPLDRSRYCAEPLDATACSGRGTHIIRQVMDEVCYDRVAEGNRLRLKKYLPGARGKP
jgi:serine/threonine-protein kinase RsbW